MWWVELIDNVAVLLGVDEATAGIFVAFTMLGSLVLAVYILTRGGHSNSKTWIAVVLFAGLILFTYPVGWLPVWFGLVMMILPTAGYIGWKLSKTARSGEG